MSNYKALKTIHFKNIDHFLEEPNGTLASFLLAAHERFSQKIERRIQYKNKIIECRSILSRDEMVLGYLAVYQPGDTAPAISHDPEIDSIDAMNAGDNTDWLEGSAAFCIKDDSVVFCTQSTRQDTVIHYIKEIILKYSEVIFNEDEDLSEHLKLISGFTVLNKSLPSAIEQIKNEGIKSIDVKASLSEVQMRQEEDRAENFFTSLVNMVSNDEDNEELRDATNSTVRLKLAVHKTRGKRVERNFLNKVATKAYNDDDCHFIIETYSGNTLTSEDLIVKKKITMNIENKHLPYPDIFTFLTDAIIQLS